MSNSTPTPSPARSRRIVFTLLAVLLPVFALTLLEVIARLVGVQDESRHPFKQVASQPDYFEFNPAYVQRYFRGFTPAAAPDAFQRQKDDGTLRLFAFGGSTVAGYPYSSYTAFPQVLEEKLNHHFLDRNVEVINLGLTAVNSYTIWDLSRSVVDYEPDVILIYAGHNEYYGAFGAGSSVYSLGNRIWLKRLLLVLKRSVLFRSLESLLLSSSLRREPDQTGETTMSRVVANREIEYESEVYRAGIAQFESNLKKTLSIFRRTRIPVYLATTSSNLKDQRPLGSNPQALREYQSGRQLLRQNEPDKARTVFVAARDLDNVRFRAPSAINERITALAGRNVHLVDVESSIRVNSPDRLEGDSLFVDHLHPDAEGHVIIARAFFDKLVSDLDDPARSLTGLMPDSALVDPIDRALAEINIRRLKSGFPFVDSTSPEQQEVAFRRLVSSSLSGSLWDSLAMRSLLDRETRSTTIRGATNNALAREDTVAALLLLRALAAEEPLAQAPIEEAAELAAAQPRFDWLLSRLAVTGWKRTQDDRYLNLLGAIAVRQNHLDDAKTVLDLAESRDPENPNMLYNQARLHVLLGDTATARRYFDRYQALR